MDIKGKAVYLSGKMTGVENWNKPAFDEAEEALYEMGASFVFNPAFDAPKLEEAKDHSFYMRRDINVLTSFHGFPPKPVYDVIALLPGWEDSQGACIELQVAIACGLEVLHLE